MLLRLPAYCLRLLPLMVFLLGAFPLPAQGPYYCENGTVSFVSNAPLEVIRASSSELRGLVDPAARTFAFSMPVGSFQGFNSSLQREHFNENYLETGRFPRASFSGKIIEPVDLRQEGRYSVRAKGVLEIHGVKMERIIRVQAEVAGGRLRIASDFSVLLADHQISIPRVVYQKIAEQIQVHMEALMSERT